MISQNIYEEDTSHLTAIQDVEFLDKSISIDLPLTLGDWELEAMNHAEVHTAVMRCT